MKFERIAFVSMVLLTTILVSQMFTTQAFADQKTITVPPDGTETQLVKANKGQIIEIGFQVKGNNDNKIQFWVQDSDGIHVYEKKTVDFSIEKVEVIAKKDDTFQLYFKNLSTAFLDDRTVTLAWNVKNPDCGAGKTFKEGECVSGGCLIATAAYGSELAPQVQLLRELRDNTLLTTSSGSSFMTSFNAIYYSFSPIVSDLERQNPIFKEAVKITITPMLATLSILNHVNIDSEQEMLGYGIGIILLNLGMYFVFPAIVVLKIRSKFS